MISDIAESSKTQENAEKTVLFVVISASNLPSPRRLSMENSGPLSSSGSLASN